MQKTFNTILKAGGLLLAASACTVMAQTASMDLTGVGNGDVAYGVYLSPYNGTVNGVPTTLICDDFLDDSYLNETWTANVSTVANLGSGVLWGQSNTATYDQMAYLVYQLLIPSNMNNINTQAAISFAIWDLGAENLTPNAVENWSLDPTYQAFLSDSANTSGVQYWLNQASSNYKSLTATQLADVTVYTPNTSDPILCNGGQCATAPPQEFLAIHTAETAGLGILAANLLGLAAFAFLFRRRIMIRR